MCSPDVSAVGLEGVRLGAQLHELHLLLPFSLLPLAGRPAAIKGGFQWREGGRKEPMMPWRVNDGILLTPLILSLSLPYLCDRHCTQLSLSHTHSVLFSGAALCQSRPSPCLLQCQYGYLYCISLCPLPRLCRRSLFHPPSVALRASFSPTTFRRSDKANLCGSAYTTISRVNSVSGCVWLFFTDFLLVYHRASFRVRAGEGSGRRHP
jgi:hypothetical protein